jgi:hypothetical protein
VIPGSGSNHDDDQQLEAVIRGDSPIAVVPDPLDNDTAGLSGKGVILHLERAGTGLTR